MRAKLILLGLLVIAGSPFLTGCNACFNKPTSPDEVRERTAAATSEVKNDAKAVAEGVRDGLHSSGADQPVDLNSASKGQLTSLPGVTDAAADRIITGRPYAETRDLVDKRILSRAEYDKIADRVTVKK